MLNGLLTSETIQFVNEEVSWREAILMSCKPLVDHLYIEPRYIDAIFDCIDKYGPYFVLGPDIALPHANYSDGVLSRKISLVILKHPTRFDNCEFDVSLIFTLAPEDATGHLASLAMLAEKLDNLDIVQSLKKANTIDEVRRLLE